MTRGQALAGALSSLAIVAPLAGPVAPPLRPPAGPPRGGMLHVVMPWAAVPDNFNPLAPGGAGATAGGTGSVLYEPLMYDNVLTGDLTPMLATAYAWSNGGRTLTIDVRQGVRWSDGRPLSAADVAFTFNYLHEHPALDVQGDWRAPLQSVKAVNASTVVLQYSQPDTVVLPMVLGQLVVPQHIWAHVASPTTFTNPHPVGSGPFLLRSWDSNQVVYTRNPHYWQHDRPYLNGVTMSAVKSNDTAQLLVLDGQASYTYDAITDPVHTYVAAHPAWNRFWWPVTALNLLYMNTQTGPFADLTLRRALAMVVDDNLLSQRAYYGAIPGAGGLGLTGVVPSQQAEWVPGPLASLLPPKGPAAARRLLVSKGYRYVHGLLAAPGGKVLPTLGILVGAGWTDFVSIAQALSGELATIGVRSVIDQQPWASYYSSAQDGHFDLLVSWSNGNGPSPYYEYYYLLGSAGPAQPGAPENTDYERFSSPYVDSLLANFASTTDPVQQRADMAGVEKTVLEQWPFIALTGRPSFFDYSTRYFTGWPDAADPYNAGEPPGSFDGGAEQVYLNVHLS